MTKKCLFCDIYNGKVPTNVLFKNNELIIFNDIRPASKNHFLVVPKSHIVDAKRLKKEDIPLVNNLVKLGLNVMEEIGGNTNDMRLGFHWPPCNSIHHLHLHFISPASQMSFLSKLIFKENSFWFVSPDYVLQRLDKKTK